MANFLKVVRALPLATNAIRLHLRPIKRPTLLQVHRLKSSYEADGKTKINILNHEPEMGLMVDGYSQYGFRLNNNLAIMGPIALFPRSVLSWNIRSPEDITEESLSIFYTIEPKLDVLVIGVGDSANPQTSSKILQLMKKYKINVDILRTEQACATFNFLNAEGRLVGAGLIPPVHMTYNENDMLQTRIRRKELYVNEDF